MRQKRIAQHLQRLQYFRVKSLGQNHADGAHGAFQKSRSMPCWSPRRWLVAIVLVTLPGALSADTIYLRNGTVLEGHIIRQNITSIILRSPERVYSIPKRTVRRVTYGPMRSAAVVREEQAKQKRELLAKQRAQEALRRKQQEAAEAERQRQARLEQEKIEQKRLKEEQLRREQQEQERRSELEKRQKQEEEEKRKAAERKRLEEEKESQVRTELEKKRIALERQARLKKEREAKHRHERSRGIFQLTGGRRINAIVIRAEGEHLLLATGHGQLLIKRNDLEKVIIQTQSGPSTIPAADVRGVEEEGEKKTVRLSGGAAIQPNTVRRGDDYYLRTPKGDIRLSSEEAQHLGLPAPTFEKAQLKNGDYARIRLQGGLEIEGVVRQIVTHQLVLQTATGQLIIEPAQIEASRIVAPPAKAKGLFARLLGLVGL